MPAGAAAGVGAVGGAAVSYFGSKKAAKAAKRAARLQEEAARRAEAKFEPFREVGEGAVYSLAQLYGIQTPGNPNPEAFNENSLEAFRKSPDYQFALDEGTRALQFSAAAKGQLRSGNTLRDLVKFGSGLATQNFGNYTNRLLQLSQLGTSAAAGSASSALTRGEAGASGVIGASNAINSGIGQVANNSLAYYALLNQSGGGYGGGLPQIHSGTGGLY